MELEERWTDIPVLLVHNVDPSWNETERKEALNAVERLHTALAKEGHPVVDVPVVHGDLAGILRPFDPEKYVIFNWCEELPGSLRSDVQAARIMERLDFTFTGSSSKVLRFSWDKAASKKLLQRNGIPTPSGRIFSDSEVDDWDAFPAIVKPAFEHCSIGITNEAVVLTPADLKKRVGFVLDELNQPALVENFIDGREFHVTLWGNGRVQALPPAEMDFSAFDNLRDRLCTFDSKFTPGSLPYEKIELRIPAVLDADQYARLETTARRAYSLFGCRDYGRIDMRLHDNVFYVLDINPNADLSPDTSMVYGAEAAGLTYGQVVSQLVQYAARRHPVFSFRE